MSEHRPTLVIGNHNYSSWSLRAWFYLTVVGFDFDVERVPLDTPEHAERIGRLSPSGRVPVLHLGGEVIWDSLAICVEIGDRHAPHSVFPADPPSRALARSMTAEMHSSFLALRAQMPMNCRAIGRKVPTTEPLQADIDRVLDLWRQARAGRADRGPWLFGSFSIPDAFFAPVALRFRTYGVETGDVERGWMNHVIEHEAMQRWLALASAESEVIEHEERGA